MLELEAVNIMLRAAHLNVANAISSSDPSTSKAKQVLEQTRKDLLSQGFEKFNVRVLTLQVNASGKVPIPSTYLNVALPHKFAIHEDTSDGGLYVWDIAKDDYHDEDVTSVRVVFDQTAFHKIPNELARWIAAEAAMQFDEITTGGQSALLLERRSRRARQKALNSFPAVSMHEATGFTRIRNAYATAITHASKRFN